MIHCNQVENELRHESQRLVNAQIGLADAANAKRELQQRIKMYEAREEKAQVKTSKEMDKVKVCEPSLVFMGSADSNDIPRRITILMSWS